MHFIYTVHTCIHVCLIYRIARNFRGAKFFCGYVRLCISEIIRGFKFHSQMVNTENSLQKSIFKSRVRIYLVKTCTPWKAHAAFVANMHV